MLIHTGDFCDDGTDAEWASFNLWLGEIKPNYRWVFIVMVNHDYQCRSAAALRPPTLDSYRGSATAP